MPAKKNTTSLIPNVELDRHTVAQLQSYLAEQNVDVPKGAKKAELVELALVTRYGPSHVAKATPAKRTAKKAAARKSVVTFTMTDFPETFPCTVCSEERPTTSFPTVKSGEPEVRKSECRNCRSARIEASGGARKRSVVKPEPVDYATFTKAQLFELIASSDDLDADVLASLRKASKVELIETAQNIGA